MSYLFLAWLSVIIIQAIIHFCFIGRRSGKRNQDSAVAAEDEQAIISCYSNELQGQEIPLTQGDSGSSSAIDENSIQGEATIKPCESTCDGTSDGPVPDNRHTGDSTATTVSATSSLTPETAARSQTSEFVENHVEDECDWIEEDDLRVYQLLKCYYENNSMFLENQSDHHLEGVDVNPQEPGLNDAQATINMVYNKLRQDELARSRSSGSFDSTGSASMAAMTSVACA